MWHVSDGAAAMVASAKIFVQIFPLGFLRRIHQRLCQSFHTWLRIAGHGGLLLHPHLHVNEPAKAFPVKRSSVLDVLPWRRSSRWQLPRLPRRYQALPGGATPEVPVGCPPPPRPGEGGTSGYLPGSCPRQHGLPCWAWWIKDQSLRLKIKTLESE